MVWAQTIDNNPIKLRIKSISCPRSIKNHWFSIWASLPIAFWLAKSSNKSNQSSNTNKYFNTSEITVNDKY